MLESGTVPAHSASKTRVNALKAATSPRPQEILPWQVIPLPWGLPTSAGSSRKARTMTPQERELVTALFDRLATLENQPRDGDAERAIIEGLRRAPNATYALVQPALVQDEAPPPPPPPTPAPQPAPDPPTPPP